MRSLLGRFHRPMSRGLVNNMLTMNNLGDGSTLSLDFTAMGGVLDPRLTFTRASSATFVNSQGYVQYADSNELKNSTMLTASNWTQTATGGSPSVTINGNNTVTFASVAGIATWLQGISIVQGLPISFSLEVTALTNTDIRASDMFSAGFGFTGQVYKYTNPSGVTSTLGALDVLTGIGLYTVTATTTGTYGNLIFGTGCNGSNKTGSITIARPQVQYGTVVPRTAYVPNASTSLPKYDAPRFDYSPTNIGEPRGLLVEGQTANLCRRSNDFNNTVTDGTQWQGSGYTFGTLSTTLPDGSTGNACRLSITSGSGSMRSAGETVVASTVYTWSFWARNNGGSQARFRVWNVIAGSSIIDYTQAANNYVSQIGGANNTSSVWVRVSVTFTTPVGCTSVFVYPCSSDSGTVDLLVWGAQLELGSSASSYIPTGASQVTRSGDSCVMTGTNFSSWSNLLEGTFLCNFQTTYSGNTPVSGLILSFDSSGSKRIIYLPTGTNTVGSFDGVSIVNATGIATGVLAKVASSYNQSNRSIVLNGGTVGTGTVAAEYLSATSLGIGTGGGVNAHFKQVKFYPTALPNAQLQALTAP